MNVCKTTPAVAAPPPTPTWYVALAGTFNGGQPGWNYVEWATGTTEDAAEDSALDGCQRQHTGCSVLGSSPECMSANAGADGSTWFVGYGPTEQDAINDLNAKGKARGNKFSPNPMAHCASDH